MKICLVDTAYPAFLNTLAFNESSTYEQQLRHVLSLQFGTSDFFSRHLRELEHECIDIVGNFEPLQKMWASEHYLLAPIMSGQDIAREQIEAFRPDVVFMQDLSFFDAFTLEVLAGKYVLAGQCSCPMPRPEKVSKFRVLMTSFPHYVKRFEELGVRGIYMPLALEPAVLEGPQPERDIDISFVGGVGRNSHWREGTDVLEAVAEKFGRRFQWYGYGLDNLSGSSPLRDCYCGEAWGRKMYEIYRRSKVVLNRHGEVSQGFTNNLRCFEVTGAGALLMTEDSPNLMSLFPLGTVCPYKNTEDLIGQLHHFLAHDEARESIAAYGQAHTLANHTYAQRMKVVSTVLQEMLVSA